MLFSALALLLCQEPSLRWSRDVDELFWQALHQLEVEERAEDAAATLASLLDEPSVQQYRGQTGYLLAQQYRALRAAGLMEEAEALLPSIRRDVANTDMAQLAESVISLADRTHPGQDGANEELLELLLTAATRDSDYLGSVMRGYGEQVVPELLRIFDRPEDYLPDSNLRRRSLHSLWSSAWGIDLAGFLDGMGSRIRLRSTEYFQGLDLRIPTSRSELSTSQRAFILKISEDERAQIAEFGMWGMLKNTGDSALVNRIADILNSGDLLAPLILDRVMRNDLEATEALQLSPAIVAAIESEDPAIQSAARNLAVQRGNAIALHHLAEVHQDSAAQRRLLLGFLDRKTEVETSEVSKSGLPKGIAAEIAAIPIEQSVRLPFGFLDQEKLEGWHEWLLSQLEDESQDIRVLALLGSIQQRLLDRALPGFDLADLPEDFPYFVSISDLEREPRLVSFLRPSLHVDEDSVVSRAANLLASSNPGSANLTVDDIALIVERKLISTSRNPSYFDSRSFLGSEIEWQDRLVSLAADRRLASSTRASAVTVFMQSARESENPIFKRFQAMLQVPEFTDEKGDLERDMVKSMSNFIAGFSNGAAGAKLATAEEWEQLAAHWAKRALAAPIVNQHVVIDYSRVVRAMNSLGASPVRLLQMYSENVDWVRADCNPIYIAGYLLEHPVAFQSWLGLVSEHRLVPHWWTLLSDEEYGLLVHPSQEAIEAILESESDVFQTQFWGAVRTLLSRGPIHADLAAILDGIALRFAKLPHSASSALYYLAVRELEPDDWPKMVAEASKMVDLVDRPSLVSLVGKRYTPELVPVLLDAQVNPSSQVAKAADEALARYARIRDARSGWAAWERQGRDGSPIDALVAKTASGKSKVVRIAAIQSLGTLEAKEALPFLVELLEDSEPEIVAAVQAALARIHAAAEGGDE
jgi:hypothetical protein